jgi:hypothetical protein
MAVKVLAMAIRFIDGLLLIDCGDSCDQVTWDE